MQVLFSNTRKILATCAFIAVLSSCNEADSKKTSDTTDVSTITSATSSSKGACELLTSADAQKVLEGPVTAGMNTESMCQYLSASEELMKSAENVSLTLHKNAADGYEKYLADTEASTGVKAEPVAGVGTKAAWAEGALIFAHNADLLILIVGRKLDKEKHLGVAKEMAGVIVGRRG